MIQIVAEISANHRKDISYIIDSIISAKECGCNYVKFQTYSADSLTIDSKRKEFIVNSSNAWKGRTLYDLYKEGSLPYKYYEKISECCNANNIKWFSTPFDLEGVKFLNEIGCPIFKIASFEITFLDLISEAASTGKPIVLSSGVGDESEILEAIDVARQSGTSVITLLNCSSNYPSQHSDFSMRDFDELKKRFKVDIGLSDHTLDSTVAIIGVTKGITMVEKHYNMDGRYSLDADFSLNYKNMKRYVSDIRNAEIVVGKVSKSEEKKSESRRFMRSVYSSKIIAHGEKFTEFNTKVIRPNAGLSANKRSLLLGKTSKRYYDYGTPINPDEIL